MLLELERLYNHVGDLGAILNDIAFGIAHSHTQAIRESLLRLNAQVTGHRLLRGAITVGATTVRELPDLPILREAAGRVAEVVAIALDHPMVLDRLTGPAVLRTEDARRMGVLGYVARASGVDVDARRDHPFVDLGGPAFVPVVETAGDVLARFTVRAREVQQSVALVESLVERLDGRVSGVSAQAGQRDGQRDGQADDAGSGGSDTVSSSSSGLGVVEAWRGLLCHRVEIADGVLTRVKVVDPSFMNWPALPVCLADTIVPDFPLANKSFNQSYAGNDL
jgi:Ni,Fe-hydrogenase III large subunit